MTATERTRAQVHTGLAHLRQVAAAKDLPPITWDRTWGYRMLDGAPEARTGYERAFFESVHHRLAHFTAGILLPNQKGFRRRRAEGRRDRTNQPPSG
ncbi:hypothetical protein [Streptomyces sp. NPDC051642]|uniref:hypothetical protein n=1 Tax=unclassified Streptomyces TaxID=2593676 RepID=UPI003419F391